MPVSGNTPRQPLAAPARTPRELPQAAGGPAPLLGHLIRFSNALREAGIKVNPASLIELCRSFEFIDLSDRLCFYAAARATMISRQEDLARFDSVFNEYWTSGIGSGAAEERSAPDPEDNSRDDQTGGEADARRERKRHVGVGDNDAGTEQALEPECISYSDQSLLLKKDIGKMSAHELEQARDVVHQLVPVLANYRSQRLIAGKKRNLVDFRRMFRRSTAYGGLLLPLSFRQHREKKTRLVLLCDVSGSMAPYSQFLIQFIYALRQVLPRVDIGVFSTRLTMISELLDERNVDESLQRVMTGVRDWGSGTDIGGSLLEFNRQFARQIVRNRTLMVILSDGWDRGDATVMRQQIEDLRRRVHKLIWLNPLLGGGNYLPLCRGIRTALPYMDYFLPAHNLASLKQVSQTLKTTWH